jgi:hypothetical protein
LFHDPLVRKKHDVVDPLVHKKHDVVGVYRLPGNGIPNCRGIEWDILLLLVRTLAGPG